MQINGDQILGIDVDSDYYFRTAGCDNCGNGLGNIVHNCHANFKLDGKWDFYEIRLCHSCICSYHNADPLDDRCLNKYLI